jgi:hypothetical protein
VLLSHKKSDENGYGRLARLESSQWILRFPRFLVLRGFRDTDVNTARAPLPRAAYNPNTSKVGRFGSKRLLVSAYVANP